MMAFPLGRSSHEVKRVLFLGAHSDDIEIGCGATILQLLETNPALEVRWVVLSGEERRAAEARCGASLFLGDAANPSITIKGFRDGFFPYMGAEIKAYFEELKREPTPDLIFTHGLNDRHQDHRLVAELTWNTFRDHVVLEYEIPKYDGGLHDVNVFVPVSESIRSRKVTYLMQAFATQRDKRWFTPDTFTATLRLRGIESAASTGYAEGFVARKLLLTL